MNVWEPPGKDRLALTGAGRSQASPSSWTVCPAKQEGACRLLSPFKASFSLALS